MKNTKVILFLALLTAMAAQGCYVTVTNDSDEAVKLYDINNPDEDGRLVNPGEKTIFGDKKTTADFLLAQKQKCGRWKKTLRIAQTKCGMTEEEENEKKDKSVTVSGIIARDLDEMRNFFSIEDFDASDENAMPEKKDTSCGCKNKK